MQSIGSANRDKAQISIEFMFLFVFLIVALVIIMLSVMQNTQSVYSSTLQLETENTLSLAKEKLDTVFLEGSGFSTNFTLPQNIIGYNYTVIISSNFLVIEISNQTYSIPLLTNNITGDLRKGENMIKNSNGQLVIS